MQAEYTKEDVLKELGLDQMPEARLPGSAPAGNINPRSNMKFKMAVQLIDAIESAAFMKYLPDWIVIDQSLDPRSFDPEHSRIMSLFTDIPIPMHPKIAKALGMTDQPHAQNHYIWLAQDVARHISELGASACSPVHIFRTSGAEGHRPMLGVIFKLKFDVPDGLTREHLGANLGLLSDKRNPEIHTDENVKP